MSALQLEYALVDGYIHNWLVAGPQAVPVADLDGLTSPDFRSLVSRQHYQPDPGIPGGPVENEAFTVEDTDLTWEYTRCLEDHMVDLSGTYRSCHYLRAWAYAQLDCPTARGVTLTLSGLGPADLWVGGQHVLRQEQFAQQEPASVSVSVALGPGNVDVLVRFEQVALRACPHVMSLRVAGTDPGVGGALDGLVVHLPTNARQVVRRQMMEQIFDQAYLEHRVFHMGNRILVRWPEDLDGRCHYVCQVQDRNHWIYVEALPEAKPSAVVDIGHAGRFWERAYDVVLQPRAQEYYDQNLRYERRMPIHVLDTAYAEEPYGTYEERRVEALEYAAKRQGSVYAEIAKARLGRWSDVETDALMETIAGIVRRQDGSDLELLGLLGLQCRSGEDPAFPDALKGWLEECILGFRYWHDEPGSDVMCFESESHRIVFHACEILAGQLYPDRTFANSGQSGAWHQEKGEKLALAWLYERGISGFDEWDANRSWDQVLAALSHLVDLAENDAVLELAAVLMDKMFFGMALNSYCGAFGSTHGQSAADMVLGARLEATSGLTRLMWGTGVWNHHLTGTVSLACSEYELPSILADIAVDRSQALWNREQQGRADQGGGVSKVTYRTADHMLCSAQDYRPGQAGSREHIWQATLSPDATVFVNHPGCARNSWAERRLGGPGAELAPVQDDARHPNFWLGNRVLPRVAQWKDVLIAVYQLSEDDPLGFTHAYFPRYAFDDCRIRDGWAFAQVKRGYLALTTAQGVEWVTRGPYAYAELRSRMGAPRGGANTWLCMMGQTSTDGDFLDFQRRVLALDVDLNGPTARCATLRGDTLSFGWQGPLMVNGQEQPITGLKQFENPLYCRAASHAVRDPHARGPAAPGFRPGDMRFGVFSCVAEPRTKTHLVEQALVTVETGTALSRGSAPFARESTRT